MSKKNMADTKSATAKKREKAKSRIVDNPFRQTRTLLGKALVTEQSIIYPLPNKTVNDQMVAVGHGMPPSIKQGESGVFVKN